MTATAPSLELRARMIAHAGAGLYPTSKVREAVEVEALKHLREATGRNDDRSHWPQEHNE